MDHLLKTKKEFKNLKEQETQNIYRNELDEACFQHDIAYGYFKDLARRTEHVLRDKASNIAKDSYYDGYETGLASMVYRFSDKNSASLAHKSAAGRGAANNEIKQNL